LRRRKQQIRRHGKGKEKEERKREAETIKCTKQRKKRGGGNIQMNKGRRGERGEE
jgi:hypothetical protein